MTNSRAVLLLLATAVVASITAAPILGEVAEIGAEDVPAVQQLEPGSPAEQDSKAPKETVKSILASHNMPTGEKDASKAADAKSDSGAQKTEGAKGGDTKDTKTAAPVKDDAAAKDAKADSAAAPKDDAKAPKDDAKADSAAAPKDDAKAPKDDAKAPKDDAKTDSAAPKDDAKADAKAPKDDAKTDSAAPKDDAKAPKADAKAPKADAKADSDALKAVTQDATAHADAKQQSHLSMLAADKEELKDAAMDAVDVKPKLKESYDDDADAKDQHIPEPATAKQPVIKPELEKDDEPMPEMPNEAPFQNKENDEDPRDKADPDPFKQRGTFTPEMEDYERQLKWEDENPVKKDGQIRPWDDLNDFQDPKLKVERAKKIADDIFEMTQRKVASKQEKMTTKTKVRDIKKTYRNSINFMRRVRKSIKRQDRREKKDSRAFDKRMKKLAKKGNTKNSNLKAAYSNMMSKMEDEDEAATKDAEKPAQWALDEVSKIGKAPGAIFSSKRSGRRL